MRELMINGQRIGDDGDCFVIAEIGSNHQGDMEKAKLLIAKARECGADAVKLQKRDNRSLYTRDLYNKPYDNENSFGKTYGEHREHLEFGRSQYEELLAYGKEKGILVFATAFDISSADFLEALNMPVYKIASGDLRTIPLLKHVAQFGKPMIVSTGGGTIEDVQRAYDAIMPINTQLAFLLCTASYPTPPEELNLRTIDTLRQRFPNNVIGLSDHYDGIAMAVAAYVLGARIIEKHFTLHHTWKGTDNVFSLEPIGLQKMVRDLRRTRISLGDGVKRVYASEKAPLAKMSKKIVAARDLPAGTVLTEKTVALKSPGDGLPPFELEKVLGRATRRALAEDEDIRFEDLR